MDQSNMLLQMAYAAVQSAQSTLPQSSVAKKSDGGQDFRALLDEKRTAVGGQEGQDPAENKDEQKTELSEDVLAQGAALAQNVVLPTAVVMTAGETQPQTVDAVTALTVVPETVQDAPVAAPEVNAESVVTDIPTEQPTEPVAETLPEGPEKAVETPADTGAPAAETVSTPQTEQGSASQSEGESGSEGRPAAENGKDVRSNDYEVLASQSGTVDRPVFRESAAMPQRVGDAQVLDTQSGELEGKLTSMMTASLEDGGQRLEIKLAPEHLGNVVVEMSRTPEGVLHVVLHTESEQAAKLLTEHADTLGMMLQSGQQGEVRIEVQRPDQGEQPWQQPDQNGGQNGQEGRQQQEQRRQHTDPEVFLQQLRLGLITAAQ